MIQQEFFGIIAKFIGQKNIIPVPVEFVRFTGDYNSAAFLTQIIYWTDRSEDPEGWIYKTYADWKSELALSEYQIRRVVNNLKGKGTLKGKCMLKTKLKKVDGNPTLHYALDVESFVDCFIPFLKAQRPLKTVVSLETKETNLEKLQERILSFSRNEGEETSVSINTETTTEPTTETTATSPPSVAAIPVKAGSQKIDENALRELCRLVPNEVRKPSTEVLIKKHLAQRNFEYVKDQILYTNNTCGYRKNGDREPWIRYKAYLGKSLDFGYGSGFAQDIESGKADIPKQECVSIFRELEKLRQESGNLLKDPAILKDRLKSMPDAEFDNLRTQCMSQANAFNRKRLEKLKNRDDLIGNMEFLRFCKEIGNENAGRCASL